MEPVLTVTDTARETILELVAAEGADEPVALWIEVTGSRGPDYAYDLVFEVASAAQPNDAVYQQGALTVVVPEASIAALTGATLDVPSAAGQGGLILRNPNKPDPLDGVELGDMGELGAQIAQLLADTVNPALAAHGGYAMLKGVDGDRVFVTMGGGCQGCSISSLTLRANIAKTIREHFPQVTEVVDVTDHDAGENPFYS